MTEKPITITPTTSAQECAKLMAKHHVGSLVVRDRDSLAGIVTERDLTRKLVAANKPAAKTKAKDVMTTNLVTVSPDKDIFEAIAIMRDYDVRHLPVVDRNRLLGLITLKDILKIEPDLFDIMVEKMEIREAKRKPLSYMKEHEGVCQSCGESGEQVADIDGILLCPDCRD